MKRSRFTEEPIIGALHPQEAGMKWRRCAASTAYRSPHTAPEGEVQTPHDLTNEFPQLANSRFRSVAASISNATA